jgi:hypothetical protein
MTAGGGTVNPIATPTQPSLGNSAGGGSGGDINLYGGDGQNGATNQSIAGGTFDGNTGGYGGDGPLSGGVVNSGTTGNAGRFPGGGASGAGTGASGTTGYNGAAGAGGFCVVRW